MRQVRYNLRKIVAKRALGSVLLFFVLFLSGCSKEDFGKKIDYLDQKIGEIINEFDKIDEEDSEEVKPADAQGSGEAMEKSAIIKDNGILDKEDKESIDKWLEENNLNRYGDSLDTFYMGGTPLFNEETGERVDRYDYILKKHSNILNN